MPAALAALIGATVLAYGYIDNQAAALLFGFLALLFALGLSQLPVWRTVRSTTAPRRELDTQPGGDLVDLSSVDWSALHRRGTPTTPADLPRIERAA